MKQAKFLLVIALFFFQHAFSMQMTVVQRKMPWGQIGLVAVSFGGILYWLHGKNFDLQTQITTIKKLAESSKKILQKYGLDLTAIKERLGLLDNKINSLHDGQETITNTIKDLSEQHHQEAQHNGRRHTHLSQEVKAVGKNQQVLKNGLKEVTTNLKKLSQESSNTQSLCSKIQQVQQKQFEQLQSQLSGIEEKIQLLPSQHKKILSLEGKIALLDGKVTQLLELATQRK